MLKPALTIVWVKVRRRGTPAIGRDRSVRWDPNSKNSRFDRCYVWPQETFS